MSVVPLIAVLLFTAVSETLVGYIQLYLRYNVKIQYCPRLGYWHAQRKCR